MSIATMPGTPGVDKKLPAAVVPVHAEESGEVWLVDPPSSLGGNETGLPLIDPESIELVAAGFPVRTVGPRRVASPAVERNRRRYRITYPTAARAAFVAMATALLSAEIGGRGTCVRWRHPEDDLPVGSLPTGLPLEMTPAWRVVNRGELDLARSRAGVLASFELELEEW